MPATGSITQWIRDLPTDEEAALAKMHERLWPQLVAKAQAKLRNVPLRAVDEEDVAQSVFLEFYQAFQADRLEIKDRKNLLALLTTMISFKIINHVKKQLTQKRGSGKPRTNSVLELLANHSSEDPVNGVMLDDCYEFFVGSLPEHLRKFAEPYLAGFTHEEIAQQMNCVTRTSERKIELAKERWRQMAGQQLEET